MIICTALRVKGSGAVLGGIRHGFIYSSLHDLRPEIGAASVEEGFLDNDGNFLNRFEAFKEALKCGQLSATTLICKQKSEETELYSEDLW